MTDPVAIPRTTVRVPLAQLPTTVLPGALVTIPLATDELRRAVDAARSADGDGRLALTTADEQQLAVVAQVPDTGSLPDGQPAAIVQIETRARVVAVHPGDRGATFADIETITPAAEPTCRGRRP